MQLIQALDVLRADIEGAIYKGLSDKEFEALEPKIRSAIEDGYKTWRERSLVTLLGKHGAKKLLEDLESAKLEEVN